MILITTLPSNVIGALWPIMSFYAELESGDTAVAAELVDTVKWPLGLLVA